MYYQLVRHMGYTWDDLMQEKVPRTLYSFEKLGEEGKKKKERQQEIENQTPKAA